jgi:hypothetical protein
MISLTIRRKKTSADESQHAPVQGARADFALAA